MYLEQDSYVRDQVVQEQHIQWIVCWTLFSEEDLTETETVLLLARYEFRCLQEV